MAETLQCATCGKDLPEGAKFCLECGAPVAAATAQPIADDQLPEDERAAILQQVIGFYEQERWTLTDRTQYTAALTSPNQGATLPNRRVQFEVLPDGRVRDAVYEYDRQLPGHRTLLPPGVNAAFVPAVAAGMVAGGHPGATVVLPPSQEQIARLDIRLGTRQLSFETSRSPVEVVDGAVHYFGGVTGWTVTSRTEGSVTFSYEARPGCGTAILLGILGIIPGLLYWFFARHVATTTMSASGTAGKTTVYLSWSHDGDCRTPCLDFARSLRQREPSG